MGFWKQVCTWILCFGFTALVCSARAEAPGDGYFYGIDMEPLGEATIETVETEPAVALIFAIDQETAEVTRQFDAWYQGERPNVAVFAIGVVPSGLSRAVALEALQQRKLTMPVYLAGSDMLLGDSFRVLVLNDDMEVARFTSLDLQGTYDALKEIGVEVPDVPAHPALADGTTTQSVQATQTETDRGGLLTVTQPDTAQGEAPAEDASEPAAEELILGGAGQPGNYKNNIYGMEVEFPPGWQFRVAGKRDGAVAVPPQGSQLDLRIWALAADGMASPQDYINQRLSTIGQRSRTPVEVDRQVAVVRDGGTSIDVTYTYTKPLGIANPGRSILWRGRMLVFVHNGYVKVAGAAAPNAEFLSAASLIDAFIQSFQVLEGDNLPGSEYSNPNII